MVIKCCRCIPQSLRNCVLSRKFPKLAASGVHAHLEVMLQIILETRLSQKTSGRQGFKIQPRYILFPVRPSVVKCLHEHVSQYQRPHRKHSPGYCRDCCACWQSEASRSVVLGRRVRPVSAPYVTGCSSQGLRYVSYLQYFNNHWCINNGFTAESLGPLAK
jgi:hypothetical protein